MGWVTAQCQCNRRSADVVSVSKRIGRNIRSRVSVVLNALEIRFSVADEDADTCGERAGGFVVGKLDDGLILGDSDAERITWTTNLLLTYVIRRAVKGDRDCGGRLR